MRIRAIAVAVAVVTALATLVGGPAEAAKSSKAVQPAYLFAFNGQDAQVAPAGKPGQFTLTVPVSRSNQLVTWFTDRPNRDAGHMPMELFVDLWSGTRKAGFATDPPNVAITSGKQTLIATMTSPVILKAADGSASLQSTMTVVAGKALTKLKKSGSFLAGKAKLAKGSGLSGAVTLPTVSVFVDDSSIVCEGYIECCELANSVSAGSCSKPSR